MSARSVEEIGAKMDALGIWDEIAPFNFAVKPAGTVFPYFCTVLKGDGAPVKTRFLMLEGWQTLHDFVRLRIDGNFGFYSSPMEMPHLELVITSDRQIKIFRHDPGYIPVEAEGRRREAAAKMLWEAYGVMMRVESDRSLPLKFSGEKAVFARVEDPDGSWRDAPLVIPPPPPYTETIKLPKQKISEAKDLPFDQKESFSLDMRIVPGLMTKEARPRTVYELVAYDSSGAKVIDRRASADQSGGLKALWEMLAGEVLSELVRHGRVPGEIKVRSGRVFRFLRPLCMELPFKLSLHDKLPF